MWTKNTFIDIKMYNNDWCKMCYSPLKFVKFVEQITEMFDNCFPILQCEENLLSKIKKNMEIIPYQSCKYFPLDYILSHFITMKIFYA